MESRLTTDLSFNETVDRLNALIITHQREAAQALFITFYNQQISQLKAMLAKALRIAADSSEPFPPSDIDLENHSNDMAAKVMWNYILMIRRICDGEYTVDKSLFSFSPKIVIKNILDMSNLNDSPIVAYANYLAKKEFSSKFIHVKDEKVASFYRSFINLQIISSEYAEQLLTIISKNNNFLRDYAPTLMNILSILGKTKTNEIKTLLSDRMNWFIWKHVNHLQKDINTSIAKAENRTEATLKKKGFATPNELNVLNDTKDELSKKIDRFKSQINHLKDRLSKFKTLQQYTIKNTPFSFKIMEEMIANFNRALDGIATAIQDKTNLDENNRQALACQQREEVGRTETKSSHSSISELEKKRLAIENTLNKPPVAPIVVSNIITFIETQDEDAKAGLTPPHESTTTKVTRDKAAIPSTTITTNITPIAAYWQQHGSKVVMGIIFSLITIGVGAAIIFCWPLIAAMATTALITMAIKATIAVIVMTAASGLITEAVIEPTHNNNPAHSPLNTSSSLTATAAMGASKVAAPPHDNEPAQATPPHNTPTACLNNCTPRSRPGFNQLLSS